MIRKYITLTIIPNSAKKVKKLQISFLNVSLIGFIVISIIVHSLWVFNTFLVEETIYGAKFIKEKLEKRKIILDKYKSDIQQLSYSIVELNNYYQRLIKISTPHNITTEPIESEELIRQVEFNKKSIFSLIPDETNNLNTEIEKEQLEVVQQMFQQNSTAFTKPTSLPVAGFVVSAFGSDSRNNKTQYSPHTGILLYTEPNSLIKATGDGFVVYTGVDDILTKTVIIYHGNYVFSKYGYLSSIEVKKLQKISEGDIIGISGGKENSSLFYQVDFLYVPQSPF